jgi:hypothetical protein
MDDKLQSIEEKVGRNYDSPPLQLWQPELSGDIDIRIDRGGNWFHEGGKIEREAIVRLFASILRREEDGEYYLVTPGEKWRIQVDLLPLIVSDIAVVSSAAEQPRLEATLNTGKHIAIDAEHPLYLEKRMESIAAIHLPHGLSALFSRSAWYRLVEMAENINGTACVVSAGEVFPLEVTAEG